MNGRTVHIEVASIESDGICWLPIVAFKSECNLNLRVCNCTFVLITFLLRQPHKYWIRWTTGGSGLCQVHIVSWWNFVETSINIFHSCLNKSNGLETDTLNIDDRQRVKCLHLLLLLPLLPMLASRKSDGEWVAAHLIYLTPDVVVHQPNQLSFRYRLFVAFLIIFIRNWLSISCAASYNRMMEHDSWFDSIFMISPWSKYSSKHPVTKYTTESQSNWMK